MSETSHGSESAAGDTGRRPGFDWRGGAEQLARLGEELRALGGGAFEAACERAGLVSRERFEVQAALLRDALARLDALDRRVRAMESGGSKAAP